MKREHVFVVILLFLVFLSFYLLYQILSPFLESILWAIFLAMIFYPGFKKLQRVLKRNGFLPALSMTIIVTLVIVIPFSYLIIFLANEIVDVYQSLEWMIKTGRLQAYLQQASSIPVLKEILTKLQEAFDFIRIDPTSLFLNNLQQIGTFLFNQSSKVLKGLSTFLFGFLLTLLSLHYLFKDGKHLTERLKEIIPLPEGQKNLLIGRFQEMVRAAIYGGGLIAIVQGAMGGLAFWILGLHSPVLWGTAMAFLSFIPIVGTALIWVPASIFLVIWGSLIKGIILLIIGVFGISLVDNFLRPHLISSKTQIHPLILFFAILGGINLFGIIGIIAGPLIVTVCLSLLKISLQGIGSKAS